MHTLKTCEGTYFVTETNNSGVIGGILRVDRFGDFDTR